MDEAVRAFLEEKRFAVLATVNPDGTPQQSVMWYALRGGTIMMNTAEGRLKAKNLRRDPRASICVEDGYRFVAISGRVELIDDQEIAQRDIADLAYRYHPEDKAREMIEGFRRQHRITILLPIRKVVADGF
ncbi:MAG: PPOX class F420-dependent oxidoreductase, partial [Thermomicrobiaceae bacterium]|nr:PPOX class F420-dependent oxidoreductase [Thermomicrobiaceae bacterium]